MLRILPDLKLTLASVAIAPCLNTCISELRVSEAWRDEPSTGNLGNSLGNLGNSLDAKPDLVLNRGRFL